MRTHEFFKDVQQSENNEHSNALTTKKEQNKLKKKLCQGTQVRSIANTEIKTPNRQTFRQLESSHAVLTGSQRTVFEIAATYSSQCVLQKVIRN